MKQVSRRRNRLPRNPRERARNQLTLFTKTGPINMPQFRGRDQIRQVFPVPAPATKIGSAYSLLLTKRQPPESACIMTQVSFHTQKKHLASEKGIISALMEVPCMYRLMKSLFHASIGKRQALQCQPDQTCSSDVGHLWGLKGFAHDVETSGSENNLNQPTCKQHMT